MLLVTSNEEFLTHHPAPPKDFQAIGDGFYARPRQFPLNLLATFPAFGPQSVIVIGEPQSTNSKTSTPWLITLMHEHFHQLQNAQPGYFQAVQDLGLRGDDNTGMWMLNYPFPYERAEVMHAFANLRDLLLAGVNEPTQQGRSPCESVRSRAQEILCATFVERQEVLQVPALAGRHRALHRD